MPATSIEWKPFRRQEQFIEIPDSVDEALFGGAAGGGKSELLLLLPLIKKFHQVRTFKGILFRRTYPELERELIIRSHEFYPHAGGIYNDGKKRWHFPAYGSYIQFGYAEYENDVRRYDTTEYQYMAFDELTSFTEFQYKYLVYSRLRASKGSNLPAIARSGTNPGNIGHSWCRKHFIDPCREGFKVLVEKHKDGSSIKRIFIPSRVTDNPHIDPTYIAHLNMLPIAEQLAKRDGDWYTFSGQVFDDWRIEPFPDEPHNARHVISAFPIPDWWPKILAIDWGFKAMLWAGFAAISPDNRIYLFDEYTCTETKISTWALEVKKRISKLSNIVDVVLDPSAWHNRGDEATIAEQFASISGIQPRQADQDRLGGKELIQELIRWKPKVMLKELPKESFDFNKAEYIRRTKGDEAYKSYVNQFIPEKEEVGLPKLQVFDTCIEFINCIPNCVYNDPNSSKNIEDVAEFKGDDPYDGSRYLFKACYRYLSSGNLLAEASRRSELEKVTSQRESNPTEYYRKMDGLEAKLRKAGRRVINMRRHRR